MRLFIPAVLLALPISAAFGASKDAKNSVPVYDPDTVVSVTAIVTEVRDVPKADPLEGINLVVKVNGEAVHVYVAPVAFVKLFGVSFKKNDVLEITGSKVKTDGADLILAREITVFRTSMSLRDQNGKPFWLNSSLPTGD